MSTMGTFDAFTSARLGIYAAQHGLRVTGNNISNINTLGYTRQRLNQVSFKAGAYDTYRSQLDNHVGSGALVMGFNQVRDPYLDVRYRNTNADVGYHETLVDRYKELADILDEVGKGEDSNTNEKGDGLLVSQIQTVATALREFEKFPTPANDTIVRNAVSTLCGLFNSYATKIEALRQETDKKFTSQVTEINECLTNIRDLNKEIRDNEIFGDNALELRDERNRQIDKLSEYIHIKVVYTEEDIGGGQMVEKLSLYLDNDNPDPTVHTDEALLVDGVYGTQFYKPESRPAANPYYGSTVKALEGVKEFLYLTDKPLADPNDPDPDNPTKFAYMLADGTVGYYDPTDPALPANATAIMQGTNDPLAAEQVEGNEHYFLQLTKLVDEFNKEWEQYSTSYQEVDPVALGWPMKDPAVAAIYSYEYAPDKDAVWADGETFKIGDTEYEVGKDIPAADANDREKMVSFIVDKLKPLYNDKTDAKYDVSADGAKIVFTARTGGAVSRDEAPVLKVSSDPNNKLNLGIRIVERAGKDATYTPPNPVTYTDPVTGTKYTTSFQEINGKWNQVVVEKKRTFETAFDDNDLYGSLQATRELLTEAGEFTTKDVVENIDESAADRRGIPFYQHYLDLLARQFATQYNKLNQGVALDEKGNVIYKEQTGTPDELGLEAVEVSDGIAGGAKGEYYVDKNGYFVGIHQEECLLTKAQIKTTDTPEQIAAKIKEADPDLYAKYQAALSPGADGKVNKENAQFVLHEFLTVHGVPRAADETAEITINGPVSMGGLLLSNRGDRDSEGDGSAQDPYINASNISVSQSWLNGSVQLVPKFEILFDGDIEHSTQNINANHMVTMIEQDLIYNPRDIVPDAVSEQIFKGNFNAMYDDMCSTLGEAQRKENINLDTHYTTLVEIDTSRDGVSGVDLNDEAMNMMQFQKAMNAAMRMMTVVDEALDRLINNTGIAGR